jgi:hypothetical protein
MLNVITLIKRGLLHKSHVSGKGASPGSLIETPRSQAQNSESSLIIRLSIFFNLLLIFIGFSPYRLGFPMFPHLSPALSKDHTYLCSSGNASKRTRPAFHMPNQ